MKKQNEDRFYIGGRKVILDALKNGKSLQKIYVQHGVRGPEINRIEQAARKAKVPVIQMDSRKFERLSTLENHQGVLALIRFPNILTQDQFIEHELPQLSKKSLSLIVYADRFNDPHNLGAIIRTSEIFHVDAVCFPLKEAAPISPGVVKASMGAALEQKLVAVRTPFNFLSLIKEKGYFLIGAEKNNESIDIRTFSFPDKVCLIIGNEENGIKHSLKKLIHHYVMIPQLGKTESFNASVAGGILLYEFIKQKKTPS